MFRFTIRELVLLTLVVAMGVGWWLDRWRLVVPWADYQRLTIAEENTLAIRKAYFDTLYKSGKSPPAGVPGDLLPILHPDQTVSPLP